MGVIYYFYRDDGSQIFHDIIYRVVVEIFITEKDRTTFAGAASIFIKIRYTLNVADINNDNLIVTFNYYTRERVLYKISLYNT